jgi:DNA (cytosine-5)-methyltransferase 1
LRKELPKIDDYPAYLEERWQEHLAPRADDAPMVISTFAGAGGSSLGYSMAGFRELLAVEWNDNAVETFKLNFPDVPVYHGDIAKLSVGKCLEMTGLQPGELDVLDGSPPCQGFSTAGKRKLTDDRNQLFREYIRLLKGLRPKVFVMENVSGMVKGKMKIIFAEILRELKDSGYKVSARLMNAMWFGVPQSRERLIFIGVREDLGIEPSHPTAEISPMGLGQIIPEAIASRSMTINPWIRHPRSAATITKTNSDYRLLTMDGIRKPVLSEVAELGSFPDGFQFRKDGWRCIGNSVPPLFMRSIALHIRREILDNLG